MSDGYVLRQYGNEVQEILDDVQQKTVYDRATSSKDGLMSSTDKKKLDDEVVPETRTVNGKALSQDITLTPEDVGAYELPSSGIPKSDLTADVQASLSKADTALQSETDPVFSESPASAITDENIASWNEKSDFSGSYNDLTDKPTIPDAQVQSDWAQTNSSAKDYIKNKPSVPSVDSELSSSSTNPVQNRVINSALAGKQDTISDLETIRSGAALGATALQSFTEADPTVPSWAKASTKPSYTASEVGALPDDTQLFSGDYNDLTNKPTIPSAVTESTVSGWGFTKNTGTITGITMNGTSKGTSGVVNLGTVITEHQDISGKANSADVYTKAQVNDMIEDVAYFGDTVGNVTTADFNAQSDTVWNKTQVLSSAQQAQARSNISAQEALVSGTNIKTINNESILGSGNITISGGGDGGGEANVIESISINGTAQTVTSKNVDLAVPTSSTITAIVTLTEAQYTALATKDSSTLYIITA